MQDKIKPLHFMEFWERLPEDERIMVDVLRQIILETIPKDYKEKLTYNVPFYYGKKRVCLIWPASVKGGGFKSGVFLGFNQGPRLKDVNQYLDHGTNKRIYYKIFQSPAEIDQKEIVLLLKEAIALDKE